MQRNTAEAATTDLAPVHRRRLFFAYCAALAASMVLSGAGLFLLTYAQSALATVLFATLFAVGVCYVWPTILGVAAAYPALDAAAVPEHTKALASAVASAREVLDAAASADGRLPRARTANALRGAMAAAPDSEPGRAARHLLEPADQCGNLMSFRWVSALSLILVVVFAGLFLRDRAARRLQAQDACHPRQGSTP